MADGGAPSQNWLAPMIDQFQAGVDRMHLLDRIDAEEFLLAFGSSLPSAPGQADRFLLRGLLVEFAGETGRTLHTRAHRSARSKRRCAFAPEMLLECFWQPRGVAPRQAFHNWAVAFSKHFRKVHPIPPATHAAHLIRQDHHNEWDVAALARRLHTARSRLAREFRREYGTSIRRYHRLVRFVMTIEHVREEKIDALALALGYKSKKNFYRTFKKITGVTPGAFRELPSDRARQIVDEARMMCRVPRLARIRHSDRMLSGAPSQLARVADSNSRRRLVRESTLRP